MYFREFILHETMSSEKWNIYSFVPEAPRGSTLENDARRRWVLVANQQLRVSCYSWYFFEFLSMTH